MKHLAAAKDAPARIRVVVVDDSATVRGFLARWLSECDDIELVGSAANGLEAVSLAPVVKPDVIILDIEMPHMNGLEALPLIRIGAPDAAVVISSRLTRKNAELTLRCLQGGATEVLPKPSSDSKVASLEDFHRDMLHKVRSLGRRESAMSIASNPARSAIPISAPAARRVEPTPSLPQPPARKLAPRIAAIGTQVQEQPRPAPQAAAVAPRAILVGASTGGPNACAELIGALRPLSSRLPIVIAQHMPPVFTRVFAEHLASATGAHCHEARDGEPLLAGRVYIGPGGHHVTVAGSASEPIIAVDSRPPVRFSRPSVDLLFLSARDVFGAQAVGVVLTGMGSDGLEGARAMAEAGARIYAQDEASSIVWGMPGAVARAGLACETLSPARIAAALMSTAAH